MDASKIAAPLFLVGGESVFALFAHSLIRGEARCCGFVSLFSQLFVTLV